MINLPAMKLGESPVWDDRRHRLFMVDIEGFALWQYDIESGESILFKLPQMAGCVHLCESGRLLLGMQDGLYFFNPETEQLTIFVELETGLPRNRCNDGACDPFGNFWVGTLRMRLPDEPRTDAGALYRIDTAGRVTQQKSGLFTPNGIGWSVDRRTMYHVDSPTHKIKAYDFDEAGISNPRVVIETNPEDGVPDGLCVDALGRLWVAQYRGGAVICYDPATGATVERIDCPATQITCPAFFGDQLVVTSAQKSGEPKSGGTFLFPAGVSGVPVFRFNDSAL